MKANAKPIDRVLAALGVPRTTATQYSARCPAHDDGNASLSVVVDAAGTVGLHCHAGCATDAVCEAIDLAIADLFADKPMTAAKAVRAKRSALKLTPSNPRAVIPVSTTERAEAESQAKKLGPPSLTGFKLVALYPYRLANGKVHGWRARYENKQGEKQIKPLHKDGDTWVLKEPKAPRNGKPIYRLPEALASAGPVFIVEGEKCADALAAVGIDATTSGAAKSAGKADWSVLAGRACVIWPDNDDPGEQYAADVAEILQGLGCSVAVIDVQAIELDDEGADAADWLAANPAATAADVLALPTIAAMETGVQLLRASDIEPKAINWLWPGYLAGSMLTLIAGNGGTGKTTIALSLAATISKGGKWPDGAVAPTGSVIIWSGEDAIAEVLVPRLQAAGADLDKIHFVDNREEPFDPASDMPKLEYRARALPDLALVIIDPIVSAVQGDSHKNAEVRRGLQPLLNLAADTGAAVVGITHYAKNTAGRTAADRVIGSVAFNAVARVTLATAIGNDGEGRIVKAKTNISSSGDGFAYSINVAIRNIGGVPSQVSSIEWGRPVFGFAEELLGQVESKRHAKDEAAEWLTAALHDGPLASKELKVKAEADGIAWRTVERAKQELGVAAVRHSVPGTMGKGEWVWRMPANKHH